MAFDEDDGEDFSGDKPVEEGNTYEVEIDDLGSKGDGIARVDGFVVFVPETEVGERVEVEINSVGRRFAFGEVVDRRGTVDGESAEAAEEPTDEPESTGEMEPDDAPQPAAEDWDDELEADESDESSDEDWDDDEFEVVEDDEDELEVPDDEPSIEDQF